ncbi:MAG: NUDIX hydrolase [Gammaproteobacteria bacterium]|nr:NUDIX hydrolase [Gammaproteobacteria bacterium]MCY4228367.1 NUDIX hydrolase [Gammaproteobacteria bacterium]MCY4313444.1 NUDIX hydrolase [Gammaproteobacteria bacterium]
MTAIEQQVPWYPHVTVAAIAQHHGKYLMVKERILGKSMLNQPAGHVEEHETLQEATVRECLEETGWRFEPEGLVGIYYMRNPSGISYLRFAYCGTLLEPVENHEIDAQIEEVLWLDRTTLEENRDNLRNQIVLKCIDDFESGKRLPNDAVFQTVQAS